MNETTVPSTASRSRVPAILLKLLALCRFFGAVACLNEVLEHSVGLFSIRRRARGGGRWVS